MTDYSNFALLGVGNGAVFAALAVALVVCYRSSGVVNFATGALALHAAFTFAFALRRRNRRLPPSNKSTFIARPLLYWLLLELLIRTPPSPILAGPFGLTAPALNDTDGMYDIHAERTAAEFERVVPAAWTVVGEFCRARLTASSREIGRATESALA